MHSATIVIPTLNEEHNIDPLLEQLSLISLPNCEINILFVDDQSKDNTVEKINAWHNKINRISVLQRTGEADLTQSILDGVTVADTDYILVMDADLSHPIDQVPNLLKPLIDNAYDVVVGSRYIKHGGIDNWPIHRRFLSWFGGLPARVLTDVKDTTSGFFACKKHCFSSIESEARGYKVLLELLASGLDQYRVTEVPIVFTDRVLGESKLSGKQMLQYFQRLLELSGGRVTGSTTGRFITVGFLGIIVDALFFSTFISNGWTVSNAHITSFFIAATFNYLLNSTWSFKYDHDSLISWVSRAMKYVFFGMLALTIRGGMLAAQINLFQIDPNIAIYPAIISAAIINYLGASFVVFPATNQQDKTHNSINWRVLAIACTGFIITLRFLYLGTAELIPDEAYYWNYKEHLNIGYLDHPPMIAWVIWLGTSVFGDNEFGVRIIPYITGLVTLYFIFRLTLLLFDKTSAYISLLITSILPFTAATGFLATTDALQVMLWSVSLFLIANIAIKSSSLSWLGLGICIGLGMLSKYSIALLAIATIIFITLNPALRAWWKRPVIYLSAILALLVFSPTLYWNAQNEWASFAFQTTRRLDRESVFSTHYLILHLLILLSPAILIFIVNAYKHLTRLLGEKIKDTQIQATYKLYFVVFTLVPLTVFIYFSLSHYPRFHWTAPIWLVSIPLLSYALSPNSGFLNKKVFTPMTLYSAGALCLLYGGILHYAALGLPIKLDTEITAHYFWKQTAEELHQLEQSLEQQTGQKPLIVGLSKWSIASALRFYDADKQVKNIVSRNAVGKTATMYEQWTNPEQWQGKPVIYIAFNSSDLLSTHIDRHSIQLQPPKNKDIYINNNKLRSLYYRTAEQYKP